MSNDETSPGGGKGKWIKGLIVSGALGSIVALALGTKRGRKTAHDVVEKIIEHVGSREEIERIVPLGKKRKSTKE